jgi:hypothetical protein
LKLRKKEQVVSSDQVMFRKAYRLLC